MQDERVFLAYLDHHVSGANQAKSRLLKFDMLAFPDAKLMAAAPAIAKSNTTLTLAALDLWNGAPRINWVLPTQARKSFASYQKNRLELLSRRMEEDELHSSREFVGYSSSRWRVFFEDLMRMPDEVIRDRVEDADHCFRECLASSITCESCVGWFVLHEPNWEAVQKILLDAALDRRTLFQREALLSDVRSAAGFAGTAGYVSSLLDAAFDAANARASHSVGSWALAFNGEKLYALGNGFAFGGANLSTALCSLPMESIKRISETREWRDFVAELRASHGLLMSEMKGDRELSRNVRKILMKNGIAFESFSFFLVACALSFAICEFVDLGWHVVSRSEPLLPVATVLKQLIKTFVDKIKIRDKIYPKVVCKLRGAAEQVEKEIRNVDAARARQIDFLSRHNLVVLTDVPEFMPKRP